VCLMTDLYQHVSETEGSGVVEYFLMIGGFGLDFVFRVSVLP